MTVMARVLRGLFKSPKVARTRSRYAPARSCLPILAASCGVRLPRRAQFPPTLLPRWQVSRRSSLARRGVLRGRPGRRRAGAARAAPLRGAAPARLRARRRLLYGLSGRWAGGGCGAAWPLAGASRAAWRPPASGATRPRRRRRVAGRWRPCGRSARRSAGGVNSASLAVWARRRPAAGRRLGGVSGAAMRPAGARPTAVGRRVCAEGGGWCWRCPPRSLSVSAVKWALSGRCVGVPPWA